MDSPCGPLPLTLLSECLSICIDLMRTLIAWASDRHARLAHPQASPSRYPDKTGWPGRPTPHRQPLLPVAFCASQAPSPRPGLLPTSFRAMFPVTPAHSAARMNPGLAAGAKTVSGLCSSLRRKHHVHTPHPRHRSLPQPATHPPGFAHRRTHGCGGQPSGGGNGAGCVAGGAAAGGAAGLYIVLGLNFLADCWLFFYQRLAIRVNRF